MLLPGARNDVPRFIAAMDVFVLSSSMEGLPLAVLEAMAAGLPVVATAVGGLPNLIDDGKTGFLVPSGDENAMRARLRALRADPALARAVGERGRRLVRERYSREQMVRRYLSLYAEMGADTGGVGRSRKNPGCPRFQDNLRLKATEMAKALGCAAIALIGLSRSAAPRARPTRDRGWSGVHPAGVARARRGRQLQRGRRHRRAVHASRRGLCDQQRPRLDRIVHHPQLRHRRARRRRNRGGSGQARRDRGGDDPGVDFLEERPVE